MLDSIIPGLYAGGDSAYTSLKDKAGWSFLRCCKEGPAGHRATLGYTTQAAPKGKDYLSASDNAHHLALNFIDANDPNFIPLAMVEKGLDFIKRRLDAGDKVLVSCNQGGSRGPTTALLYLRSVGELDGNFIASERTFRTLYPNYEPAIGVRTFARQNWNTLRKETHG